MGLSQHFPIENVEPVDSLFRPSVYMYIDWGFYLDFYDVTSHLARPVGHMKVALSVVKSGDFASKIILRKMKLWKVP